MTEQMLIRLAMILQNQAPSTLNKYICKLAEAILSDYPSGLTIVELSTAINNQFNLSFTLDEIETAIDKKAGHRIILANGYYLLNVKENEQLYTEDTLIEKLNDFIAKFIETSVCAFSVSEICSLLLKYLYFCFNSNVDNLLSLLNGKATIQEEHIFEATNEEIFVINLFIQWDDAEKNRFIYSVVAMCYEYCMLTTKKDNLLSKELFKGKRFYLDSNIIFRMAGINNEERQFVTQDFVRSCCNAGIELYCTSSTLDEVYRVVAAQVDYIRGITDSAMPVSCDVLEKINPCFEVNDFYRLYFEWCNTPGNKYGDYASFQRYLLELVQEALKQLKIKQSTSYKVSGKTECFDSHVKSLLDYKITRKKWKNISTSSVETDVTNTSDIIEWRNGKGQSIWQTNDFIVSADQLLIGWAATAFSGIPIVVLPSVWLSIILRYTGRSDDDYKSFCLFLTQRQHINAEDVVDTNALLKRLNSKTNSQEIKEQIIIEIAQNKTAYPLNSTDEYDSSIDRAFDSILAEHYGKTSQQISEMRGEMEQQLSSLAKSSKENYDEKVKIEADNERQKTTALLSKKQAYDSVKIFRRIGELSYIFYLLGGGILIFGVAVWMFEIQPFYSWATAMLPAKLTSNSDSFINAWTIATCGVGLVIAAVGSTIKKLGDKSREQQLYKKYYKNNMKLISDETKISLADK